MSTPEVTSLDREVMNFVNKLGVEVEGLPIEIQNLPVKPEENVNVAQQEIPNISKRLVDHFYDHMGKVLFIYTIAGAGSLGGMTLDKLRYMDNSFPNLAINVLILGSSLVGGAAAGYIGGLISGLGIAGVGYGMEKLEEKIRRHFTTR